MKEGGVLIKKIWLNKKYVAKLACKWTAGLFSFLGFIGTFVSLSDIVPDSWSFMCKLLLSFAILADLDAFIYDMCSMV